VRVPNSVHVSAAPGTDFWRVKGLLGMRRVIEQEHEERLFHANCQYTCRWLDGSSLIFADNVKGLKLDPPNRVVNNAGCTHGNYWRPISLGKNATDVTFTEGRDYMS